MTYHGLLKDGQILLDAGESLPEGTEVRVEVKGRELPADLAENHDHYAHGKPKS